MAFRNRTFPFSRALILILLASFLLIVDGCSYGGYYMRQAHWRQTFTYLPSMSALNQVAPEDSLVLVGRIIKLQNRQEPLLLVAVSNKYRKNEKVALVQIHQKMTEDYTALLPKGDYELFVFADLDKNEDFEWNELIGHVTVTVSVEHAKDGAIMEGAPIIVDFEHPGTVDFRLSETVRPTSYVYTSLDNELFDPKYGTMGLYNPAEFMTRTQGLFFGLEEFNEKKTTVLFVHGISGTPRDWKYLVSGLDRSRFQPFFFYYPSGLPLDKLGTMLAQIIESIDNNSKNGGNKIVLVAHSMGGLVALSAINKLSAAGVPSSLKGYCSFSTPYAGDQAAKKWIDDAPVVVPVWLDIAAPSKFLDNVISKPFPKQLPFYLFFSYNDASNFRIGESSDGTVTLRSQLVPSLQTAAAKVIGFNETHVGILNSLAARDSFLSLLDTVSLTRHIEATGQ